MSDITDFNGYSHGQLRQMVQSMDSGAIMSASDPWRRAADTLKQIHTSLTSASGDATASWEGATSDAFCAKMTALANSVNYAATYAHDTATSLQNVSEAIDQAKRNMPEEPSFWDKAGSAVTDTAEAMVGQSPDQSITDQRKAQAVGVMETLSLTYRTTTTSLKPPSISYNDPNLPPPDSSAAEALSGLIMGAGMGFVAANSEPTETSGTQRARTASYERVSSPKVTDSPAPTDSAIRGGIPNPAPKPTSSIDIGPGTGLDGIAPGAKTAGTGFGLPVDGIAGVGNTNGSGGAAGFTTGGLRGGIGGAGIGGAGSGAVFGAEEGSAGSGGFRGSSKAFGAETGSAGSGNFRASNKAFGATAVGESEAGGSAGAGAAGRQAFTEGGSGLGRSRGQVTGAQPQGMGGSHVNKKDKNKGKNRPDYLVEDEETWASGGRANPGVVE